MQMHSMKHNVTESSFDLHKKTQQPNMCENKNTNSVQQDGKIS